VFLWEAIPGRCILPRDWVCPASGFLDPCFLSRWRRSIPDATPLLAQNASVIPTPAIVTPDAPVWRVSPSSNCGYEFGRYIGDNSQAFVPSGSDALERLRHEDRA